MVTSNPDSWRLSAEIVAGAVNNQLEDDRHALALHARGVTYVPDCVANSEGVLNGAREVVGWSADESARRIEGLFHLTIDLARRG